jgi:hypothetical protein
MPRVDVHERQLARAGQQRRPPGQLRQHFPARFLQLAHVASGERAQERAQRGRGPDLGEQIRHRAMAQQVHVVDCVRVRGHRGDQAGIFASWPNAQITGGNFGLRR